MENKPRLLPLLAKTVLLFLVFNFGSVLAARIPLGRLTLYNHVFPGRERLPFGESRESYNLSLFNLDAMFASHVVSGATRAQNEYRVFLLGDSSVWGTLLRPEETLAGQINLKSIHACGKNVRAYNLGYPTISLTKDLMILDQALDYQPNMVVWLTTLEAFPNDKQPESPLVANNSGRVGQLIARHRLSMDPNDSNYKHLKGFDRTFIGQRRSLADLLRLQLYGALWSSTGVDQVYPLNYDRAQADFESDENFHDIEKESFGKSLAWDVLEAGMQTAKAQVILINEPMLIGSGRNSDIRYNFLYPRWAYDRYRDRLARGAEMHRWNYIDLWDLVPPNEFTNSAIHLTPFGESKLADAVAKAIRETCK